MKYSEKMNLIFKKGYTKEEIKALEEQEAAEKAEEEKNAAEEKAEEKAEDEKKEQSALELAESMIKDLEGKLEAKEDELTRLNRQFAELNNLKTVKEKPEKKYTASDVFGELFNGTKKEV